MVIILLISISEKWGKTSFICKLSNSVFVWHRIAGPCSLCCHGDTIRQWCRTDSCIFFCITPRQTVLLVGDSPLLTARVGGEMGACACLCEWEREEERDQNKVGGMERMNEKRWGNTHTHTLTTHWCTVHTDDSITYVWVSRPSVWVEGCRSSAAYSAVRLIPAIVSQRLLAALRQFSESLVLSSHMGVW